MNDLQVTEVNTLCQVPRGGHFEYECMNVFGPESRHYLSGSRRLNAVGCSGSPKPADKEPPWALPASQRPEVPARAEPRPPAPPAHQSPPLPAQSGSHRASQIDSILPFSQFSDCVRYFVFCPLRGGKIQICRLSGGDRTHKRTKSTPKPVK